MRVKYQIINYQAEAEPGEDDLRSLVNPEAWVEPPEPPRQLHPELIAKLIAEVEAEEIGAYPNNFYLAVNFDEDTEDFYLVHTELAP